MVLTFKGFANCKSLECGALFLLQPPMLCAFSMINLQPLRGAGPVSFCSQLRRTGGADSKSSYDCLSLNILREINMKARPLKHSDPMPTQRGK